VHLKNLSFLAKSKSVFSPVFPRKINNFRRPAGGVLLPIGVTAALLGRLLPSDGHKLVKEKHGNLGPKVPQIVRFLTSSVISILYGEL
jgi:hypothetical protein